MVYCVLFFVLAITKAAVLWISGLKYIACMRTGMARVSSQEGLI